MEWFLSNEDNSSVYGYSKYFWNGNTTLTWAEFGYDILNGWEKFGKETILSSECISKKEILDSINSVFGRKIIVLDNNTVSFNKCLNGHQKTSHIKEQLFRLKEFYYD
jgi:hypothetical protein